ncbi:hypothetical protein BH18ACI5_BH18ACI5_03150 [soil metagenome]
MSFLDRFKLQPKWKNADAAIRLSSIPEIPDDAEHLVVLQELAREDADVRVRRAAGARLARVEDVVQLTRSESDEDMQREYVDRLVGIATASAPNDADAALALDGLDDQKQFSTIAKSSPHDTVRTAALGRIHEVRLLSSVARHATDSQTAAEAVARIPDPAELLNIALKTEHKDAGIAALERALEAGTLDARETLENLSSRAKSKSVAKRARAIIQTMDEEEAAKRASLEQWQQRVTNIVARVEAIAANSRTEGASAQLDDAEQEWRTVTGDGAYELDTDTSARFGALVAQARTEMQRIAREEADRQAEAQRRQQLLQARTVICDRVEEARGDNALEEVERARSEWEGLPAPEPAIAEEIALNQRFQAACRRAAERHEKREEMQKMGGRLGDLSVNAEQLTSRDDTPEVDWNVLVREWQSLRPQVDELDPAVEARFAAADEIMRRRADERHAAAERTLKQNVQRVEQLIERATKRATAEDLTLREADRISRDLRNAIEAPPMVPRPEQQVILDRLKEASGLVTPKLHELREMDEWKRFANAAVQEEMIARAEALRAKFPFDKPEELKPEQLDVAAKELHEIQERWKLAADAPRAQAQALWHRYRQAADPIQGKVREFFALRAAERKENLDKKMALITRAEALADSTDWAKTAEELKKLQAEWQAVGAVPRQESRDTWKRFREACDKFFSRRNADLAERKETWNANLARKEALCARAEELAASTSWEAAASEMRRMQAEWKTIGPVRRNKSEVVWQRFRAAADAFFDRYKRRDQIELESKQADREGLVTELETLGGSASTGEPAAVLEQVRSLRTRWNSSTPVVRQGADPLSGRFMDALERLITGAPDAFRGTELDAEANRDRMEKLIAKVEGLAADSAAPSNSSQALATMLREALASNTIGGRAGEEAKWKAMAEDVRQAQSAWSRLGPVPGELGREMNERFRKACNRFFDQYRRKVPPTTGNEPRRGKPVGAR